MKYFAYSQKEFVYKYVVMMSDVDQFQHMSFANYLKLMFLASDALFFQFFTREFLENFRLIASDSRMQFKRQSMLGDHILIKINASQISNNNFTLLYTFVVEKNGDLIALGKQEFKLIRRIGVAPAKLPKPFTDLLLPMKVDEEFLLYKY